GRESGAFCQGSRRQRRRGRPAGRDPPRQSRRRSGSRQLPRCVARTSPWDALDMTPTPHRNPGTIMSTGSSTGQGATEVIRIHKHGGPEEMRFETVDLAPPGAGQVRLKQTAVGLNFIDVYTRTGLYPGQTPAVLGVEAAGVVEALGEGVEGLKP